MLLIALILIVCIHVNGHGYLSFPPARTGADTAVHTAPCGGQSAGQTSVIYWIGNAANNVTYTITAAHGGKSNYSVIPSTLAETEANFGSNLYITNTVVPTVNGPVSEKITFTKECAKCVLRWTWVAGEASGPYIGCSDIAILSQEAPVTKEVVFQKLTSDNIPSAADLKALVAQSLQTVQVDGYVAASTPVRDDSACSSGYEVCFTTTLTFYKHYNYATSTIVGSSKTSTDFDTSGFQGAMIINGFTVAAPSGGGGGGGGSDEPAKKNTIAASILIIVVVALMIGLHYLIGGRLLALGDKITFPLRHHYIAMIVFNVLQLIFVLAALGTTDWAHDESGFTQFGLWQFCFNGRCENTGDTSGTLGGVFNAVRAFVIFAFFSAVTALVAAILLLVREEHKVVVSKVLFVSNVLIALFTFMSMCLFAAYYNDGHLKDAGFHYGGGFGLVVFVWLVCLFGCFLSFVIRNKVEKGPSAVTPKGSAPTEQTTMGEAQDVEALPTGEAQHAPQTENQEGASEPTYTTEGGDQGGNTQEV